MAESGAMDERFEQRLAVIIRDAEQRGTPFSDDDLNEIRDILLNAGKEKWSSRPRTYAVLRMIGEPCLMEQFVQHGLSDYNFPYKIGRVPLFPGLKSQTLRRSFVRKQSMVLTDIKRAEKGGHASLSTDGEAHFQVLNRLGRGGQAVVDKVKSQLSLKVFARKSILRSKKFEGSTESEIAFTNELGNLKRLSHLHLVKYAGSYTDPRVFAIFLVPIAECDLKTYLERDPFPREDLTYLREFFGCITSAITYLHRHSCRHKDITSKNILVKRHRVYVTDFGLALDWSEMSKSKSEGPVGKVSINYVAPEVWDERGPRGSASDIWALGCVFLDIVTVLKGRRLAERKEFLEQQGSNRVNPRENFDGYNLWMERLGELHPRQDTLPILWTRKLIVFDPGQRSSAEEMLDKILNCHDVEDGYIYHCLQCGDDDGGEAFVPQPIHGGESEEDEDEGIPESSSKKNCWTAANIQDGLCNAVQRSDKKDAWLWLKRWTARSNCESEMAQCSALHLAAKDGSTAIVTDLLKSGFDANAEVNQSYPLIEAVAHSNFDTTLILLDAGADPNVHDSQGQTPLHLACSLVQEQMVKVLLKNGANANATDVFSSTPLHRAVRSKSVAIVADLLKQPGIDPTIRETQASVTNPFFASVLDGDVSLVEAFVRFGVHVNDMEPVTGYSPLHATASAKKLDVARLLIEKGANVNAKLATDWRAPPLFIAIQRDDESMVRLLLDAGADREAVDNAGFTAVHAAAHFGSPQLVPLLAQKGFNIDKVDNFSRSPLATALLLKRMAVARALLDAGASIQADYPQRTLLHDLVILDDVVTLRFLISFKEKVSVDSRDSGQLTPLMQAATRGRLDAARVLIENGADVEAKDPENATALFGAIAARQRDMVELLLSKGANVHARARGDLTPLHLAAMKGTPEIGRLLLDYRADASAKDSGGKTALQRAKLCKAAEMVELLGPENAPTFFQRLHRTLRWD